MEWQSAECEVNMRRLLSYPEATKDERDAMFYTRQEAIIHTILGLREPGAGVFTMTDLMSMTYGMAEGSILAVLGKPPAKASEPTN
jgi:hypothetical protein